MRFLAFALLLAACSPVPSKEPADSGTYAGQGRDRLCMKGSRIGFIAYGQGNTNCSLRGRFDRAGEHLLTIIPDGDRDCRIGVEEQGETLRLGEAGQACAYYCGPGAGFEGKGFTRNSDATPAVDFAGDPLC